MESEVEIEDKDAMSRKKARTLGNISPAPFSVFPTF
jgi:hypothetical protein